MHRADMVDVFVRHLPPSCTIHTSKRLIKYTEPQHPGGAYALHFADGSVAEVDVIVGADGIKSKTRAAMYEYAHARECLGGKGSAGGGPTKDECERCRRANPKWTGTVAYRYLIPTEKMQAVNPKHHALEIKAPMSVGCASVDWVERAADAGSSTQVEGRFVPVVLPCIANLRPLYSSTLSRTPYHTANTSTGLGS